MIVPSISSRSTSTDTLNKSTGRLSDVFGCSCDNFKLLGEKHAFIFFGLPDFSDVLQTLQSPKNQTLTIYSKEVYSTVKSWVGNLGLKKLVCTRYIVSRNEAVYSREAKILFTTTKSLGRSQSIGRVVKVDNPEICQITLIVAVKTKQVKHVGFTNALPMSSSPSKPDIPYLSESNVNTFPRKGAWKLPRKTVDNN